MTFTVIAYTDISQIEPALWDRCFAEHGGPCLTHRFLHCLENSKSVGDDTGWRSYHLGIFQHDQPIAFIPGYIKTHSYGEYIFDHAWANAYSHHGHQYYPKWINAVPFTPVTSQRIGWVDGKPRWHDLPAIIEQVKTFLYEQHYSSMHLLFVNQAEQDALQHAPVLHRLSLQFEWQNQAYTSFTDYLSYFTSRKRRSINKERKKVQQQQVTIERLAGAEITTEHMAFFYDCYRVTYLKRSGHDGYLTAEFFTQLFDQLKDNVLLVLAKQDEQYIAGAMFLFDDSQLYGRYWGALREVDGLHFECCYYQGIEFAIEQGISRFNPGTQGEHKILRGFAPTYCHSFHSLAMADFEIAVDDFLQRERIGVKKYKAQCEQLLPFKQDELAPS